MPIQYVIETNYLTDPISYYPRPVPIMKLQREDIVAAMILHNPDLDPADIVMVVAAVAAGIVPAILAGAALEIDNFISTEAKIRMNLQSPDDLIRRDALDYEINCSGAMKQEVNQMTSLVEIPKVEKQPYIAAVIDTNSGIYDFIENGRGLRIEGTNLRISSESEAALTVVDVNGVEYKQERLSVNNPSLVIITPIYDFPNGPAGNNSVEMSLFIETTYTEGGSLRKGEYVRKIRNLNQITAGVQEIFLSGLQTTNVARITAFTCPVGTQLQLIAHRAVDDKLYIYAILNNISGESVEITAAGLYDISTCEGETVTVDVLNYSNLETNIDDYFGFINEVILLEGVS